MPDRDRMLFRALGGVLIALTLFGTYAGFWSTQVARDGPQIAEQREEDRKCEPGDDGYYTCADLAAQEGMRRATDRLVEQGSAGLILGYVNLVLLIGTLGASVIATWVARDAVKVARIDMENALQPRLTPKIETVGWDPAEAKGPDVAADAETHIRFHNFGEGAALLRLLYARHYWSADYPEPLPVLAVTGHDPIPDGMWSKKDGDSLPYRKSPSKDLAGAALPKGDKTLFWFIAGFVLYEGLPGSLYLTRFCVYYDVEEAFWRPGPPEIGRGSAFNSTVKADRRWYQRAKLAHQEAAQL